MPTISTKDYVLDQASRRIRTSPFLTVPGMGAVEKRLLAHDWPQHAWADPPAGSDLKPVMGDNGLPILGHMIEMFRGGPDYWLHLYRTKGPVSLLDSPILPSVVALGPDAIQALYSNRNKDFSQQGWVPAIGPFFKRGLMLLDFDEHMYHRRIMQEAFVRTRLAGYTEHVDKVVSQVIAERLGRQRRTLPAVSGDEGAHPRHRLDGVHGPRAGHRQGAGDEGEQGVHRHHARGQRHHPHQRAAVHVVARSEGPRIPGAATSRSASRSAAARTAATC